VLPAVARRRPLTAHLTRVDSSDDRRPGVTRCANPTSPGGTPSWVRAAPDPGAVRASRFPGP
jgi:hypothetical protein